jgi:hypothetical protein
VVIEDERVTGSTTRGAYLPRAIAPELLRAPAQLDATAPRTIATPAAG